MKTRICRKCQQLIPLAEFAIYTKPSGGRAHRYTCRACERAYYKGRATPEFHAERRKRERQWTPEQRNKYQGYQRQYRVRNKQRLAAYAHRYRTEHRAEILSTQRASRRKNPQAAQVAARVAWHKRRARKRGNGGQVDAATFAAKRLEYNGLCPYCYARIRRGHFDHVIALSRGGAHEADNIVWSCARCNTRKKDMRFLEFLLIRLKH